ncbi:hypothetical protein L9F63_010567 [Diploptera punctata]|uniref:Ionotropic glutamate receptor C-terminal domain-containing protein n=1 Tax=Diploptera punctata TaxID=6984 RepID=A0AAD8AJS1_DIPPU|nr:hypothetical protein L9F63_010567 [Diploptera punctata]
MKWDLVPPVRNISHSDIENNVIKYIHNVTKWRLTIEAFNSYRNKYVMYKFDGFILMMLATNLKNDVHRHTILKTCLSLPEAKILIIILGVTKDLTVLLDYLNEFSLIETIVMTYENETGEIEILTSSPNDCGNVEQLIKMGFCKEGKTYLNLNLLPKKSNIFKNCTLSIMGTNEPPFFTDGNNHILNGITLQLIGSISDHLGFVINDNSYSRNIRRSNIILFDHYFDYILNPYIIGVRYYTESYMWFVPKAELHPRWSSLTRVFKTDTWVCVMIIIIAVSLSLQKLATNVSLDFSKWFLNTWAMFLNIAIVNPLQNFRFRSIFFTWVAFSIAFTTVFQARVTSFFTDPGKANEIDTIKKLEESNLELYLPSSQYHNWPSMFLNKSEYYSFSDEMLPMLTKPTGINFATMTSREKILYNFRKYNIINQTDLFLEVSDKQININKFVIMDISSPFRPLIFSLIKRLVESGIVEEMVKSAIDPSDCMRSRNNERYSNQYVPLSLFHMISLFVYLFVGLAFSCIVFLVEILIHRSY